MKIQVTVDLGLSPRMKRWTLRLGIPALVVGLGAVAYAFTPPATWSAGDILQASDLNNAFVNLQAQINLLQAGLADAGSQVATLQAELADASAQLATATNPDPACPLGYTQGGAAAPVVNCLKGSDELVKVGHGMGAFWIDRYESSLWTTANAQGGTQVADTAAAIATAGLPDNGQSTAAVGPVYALSITGVTPSGSVTWFQAERACAASGKRIPADSDWLLAASGTPEPNAGSPCRLSGGPATTGTDTGCVSAWGAEDMVGSLWEWTTGWWASLATTSSGTAVYPWPPDYAGMTNNIISQAFTVPGQSDAGVGAPAASLRGGSYYEGGSSAGVFAMSLNLAPSYGGAANVGFRCVVPNAR